jgi:hypothetical protein
MTEKPDSVRVASRSDEESLFSLLVALHSDNPLGLPYREEIVRAVIETGTRPHPETRTNPRDSRKMMIGVIDGVGYIEASIGISIEPASWYTDVYGARELWLYVRPGLRKGLHHARDLFHFGSWVRQEMLRGIREEEPGYRYAFPLLSGPTSHDRLPEKERLWAMYGHKIGSLYLMD